MILVGGHLNYFRRNVMIVYLGKMESGGNGDIRKCHIEGESAIPIFWKFAGKTEEQNRGNLEDVVQCWGHGSTICIRNVVHPFKSKGMEEPLGRC
jgi:hypothetical protein